MKKTNTRSRIVSILLVLVMLLSLLPTTALAATYPGSVRVYNASGAITSLDDGECLVTNNGSATSYAGGTSYVARYDSGTLYLKDYHGVSADGQIYADGDLNIVVENDSSFTTSVSTTNNLYGIQAGGKLNISGSGKLTVTANGNGDVYGIYAKEGVTISAPLVVNVGKVDSSKNGSLYGIYTKSGAISLSGNDMTVTATGGTSTVYGVYNAADTSTAITNNGNIGISGTLRPTVTVTDSRGRSVTVTGEAVTVAAYYPPAITASMAARCAADGTEKDDGAYLKVKCAAQCADVQGHNTVVLRARFRPMGGAWSGYVTLLPGAEQLLGGGLDSGTSYEVELSAEDTVGNVRVVRYTAATSRVTLHLRAGGMGAAFGKYAEQEALECVWPAVFYGDVAVSGALTVNGQTVEAMLFPVGSVRLTDSPAAPETPAGAVWESVETGIAGVYGWRRTT